MRKTEAPTDTGLATPEPSQRTIAVLAPGDPVDAKVLARHLKNGSAALVTLEGVDRTTARRIVDVICGIVYGLDGSITRVSHEVLLVRP